MARLGRPWLAGLMAVVTLTTASAAQSAVYAIVESSADTVTVMDPGAVEHLDGGLLRAWSVTVKRNLVSGGPPRPGYVRTINEYDCQQSRLRWRSFVVYSRFGAPVLKQDNPDPSWGPAAGDTGLRMVCDGLGGGSVAAAQSVGQLVLSLMAAWDEATPLPPLQLQLPPPKPLKGKPPKAKAAPRRAAAKRPAP